MKTRRRSLFGAGKLAPIAALLLSAGLAGAATLGARSADTDSGIGVSGARHLVSRTGFGASPAEIETFRLLTREQAVDRILAGLGETAETPMPSWTRDWIYPADQIWTLGPTVEEFFYVSRDLEADELRLWWLREMVTTASPQTERLTLFWHDHFAVKFSDVENSHWLARQNAHLRRHAAGNFWDLAAGMLKDPMLLAFLTNTENTRDKPNENLAREFFELFTLGEGRGYTEADVKEAARALTGHGITALGEPGFALFPEEHDAGSKTVFGKTGPFKAEDLLALVFDHPEFGPYIVEKLWLEFVSDQPDPEEIKRLAAVWRSRDFALKPLYRALLLSDAFWDPANRGRLIKSPVELYVGTVRSLGLTVAQPEEALWALEDLGQLLFEPPNVAGWPGGTAWITDASAVARTAGLSNLLSWQASGSTKRTKPPAPDQPGNDGHMPSAASKAPATRTLQIGAVFATEAETYEDGEERGSRALLTLYDVRYGGRRWRSLTLNLEQVVGEELPYLDIFTGDCTPLCFPSLPRDQDERDWIGYAPEPDLRESFGDFDPADLQFAATLIRYLPEIVEQTRPSLVWSDTYAREMVEEEGFQPAPLERIQAIARDLADRSVPVFNGIRSARFRIEEGAAGVLGLSGLENGYRDGADLEDVLEAREAGTFEALGALQPKTAFVSASAWMNALAPAETADAAAEQALLALPLPVDGKRREMIASDPEALIRRIVLSPQYQVN